MDVGTVADLCRAIAAMVEDLGRAAAPVVASMAAQLERLHQAELRREVRAAAASR